MCAHQIDTYNGAGDLGHGPCDHNLRHWPPLLLCNLPDAPDNLIFHRTLVHAHLFGHLTVVGLHTQWAGEFACHEG